MSVYIVHLHYYHTFCMIFRQSALTFADKTVVFVHVYIQNFFTGLYTNESNLLISMDNFTVIPVICVSRTHGGTFHFTRGNNNVRLLYMVTATIS